MTDDSKELERLLAARFGLAPQPAWGPAIARSVARLAHELRLTAAEVVTLAQRDDRRLMQLAASCTINESYFFRHPEHLAELVRVVAGWRQQRPSEPVVIWSAGCSHGQEPYSVAMALAEKGLGADGVSIRATDVSADAIEAARAGVFHPWSCRGLTEPVLARYFRRCGPDALEIDGSLRTQVVFRHGSISDEAQVLPSNSVHIILFRNVAIYLAPQPLAKLYDDFARILRTDGLLFVAPSDPVPPSARFHCPDTSTSSYRARRSPSLAPPEPSPALVSKSRSPNDAADTAVPLKHGADHLSRGDYQAAVGELRLAVCLDPTDALTRFWYAVALARTQGRQRALMQLQALIEDLGRDAQDRRLRDDCTTVGELLHAVRAYKEQLQ